MIVLISQQTLSNQLDLSINNVKDRKRLQEVTPRVSQIHLCLMSWVIREKLSFRVCIFSHLV